MTTYLDQLSGVPGPVLAYGTHKLISTYTGNCLTVYNSDTAASQNIGFIENDLDTTTLDAFLNGTAGNVTAWFGQLNNVDFTQTILEKTGNTTSESTVITGLASTSDITLRQMMVGPGIPFNALVSSIDGPTQITMQVAATADGTGVTLGFTNAPHVSTFLTGNSRGIIFQGDSLAGSFDQLISDDISALNVTAKDYTISMVVAPSSSMYANQAGAPGLSSGAAIDFVSAVPVVLEGTIAIGSPIVTGLSSTANLEVGDVVGASGVSVAEDAAILTIDSATQITMTANANVNDTLDLTFARPVVRVYNDSELGERGAWQVNDSGSFDFVSDTDFVEINSVVLTITSDATGVKLWKNGRLRATASRSSLTRTAAYMYLGTLANSVAGVFAHGFGGRIGAVVVYDYGLSQIQQSILAGALYEWYGIGPSIAKFATNYISLWGDSIPAGYTTLGTYGYANYLLDTVSLPARFNNYAVAGSTCTQNPAGGPTYANTTGLFPIAGAPTLPATNANKGRVVIFHCGGNDQGFGPTGRAGTTNGTNTILMADTSNISTGDYVFASNIATLATVVSINPNVSITISTTASSSATVFVSFTYAATSPAAIYDAIEALVSAALTAGATKVIVATILPRLQNGQTWNEALNTLLVAGVAGATVVDAASYPGLDTNPGPCYADSAHLTALGHQTMAECLLPEVDSGLIE